MTKADLDILNLKASLTLFPTLVNSAGELRTRVEKAQRLEKNTLDSLKEKRKTFQEISTAAIKQANKIQEKIKELEESEQVKRGAKAQRGFVAEVTLSPASLHCWKRDYIDGEERGTMKDSLTYKEYLAKGSRSN